MSPTPVALPPFTIAGAKRNPYIPPLPFLDSVLKLASISLISGILVLSLVSLCFIFYLRFKTRKSSFLQNFNSLWTIRFLLVFLIFSWALNEFFRLPFFIRNYLIFPNLTFYQQANFCKIHVVLSLGFLEPGFLAILLFLVKVSIRKRDSYNKFSFLIFFAGACIPPLFLQIFAVYFTPTAKLNLPAKYRRCWNLLIDEFENERIHCSYPLLSTIIFAAFGIFFSLGFLISCWRVVSVVINKGLRVRIYVLACSVLMAVPLQIVFMGLLVFRGPEDKAYGGVNFVVFVSALACAAVGEAILVISPITDTLSAGGDCCRWAPGNRSVTEDGINIQKG